MVGIYFMISAKYTSLKKSIIIKYPIETTLCCVVLGLHCAWYLGSYYKDYKNSEALLLGPWDQVKLLLKIFYAGFAVY